MPPTPEIQFYSLMSTIKTCLPVTYLPHFAMPVISISQN